MERDQNIVTRMRLALPAYHLERFFRPEQAGHGLQVLLNVGGGRAAAAAARGRRSTGRSAFHLALAGVRHADAATVGPIAGCRRIVIRGAAASAAAAAVVGVVGGRIDSSGGDAGSRELILARGTKMLA